MSKKLFYIAIILLYFSCSKANSEEPSFTPPRGVLAVETAHKLKEPNKVEVIELLWLGCPHCKDFHPSWVQIKKKFGTQANFLTYPATSSKWEFDTRVFFAIDEMGLISNGLLANYYEARQSRNFPGLRKDPKRVADWLQQRYGVKNANFLSVFSNEPLMAQRTQEVNELLKKYPFSATPTVLISVPSSGQTYIVAIPQLAAMKRDINTILQNSIKNNIGTDS